MKDHPSHKINHSPYGDAWCEKCLHHFDLHLPCDGTEKIISKNCKISVPFPVPSNKFGIFAYHTQDNKPLPEEVLKRAMEAIEAMEPKYLEELKKTGSNELSNNP